MSLSLVVVVQSFFDNGSVKILLYHKNNRLNFMFRASGWEVRFGNFFFLPRRKARLLVF